MGDIQLFVDGEEYFIEAKSRQNLNLHQSLGKAIEKSSDENTVLFWKNLRDRVTTREEQMMECQKLFQCHMNFLLSF